MSAQTLAELGRGAYATAEAGSIAQLEPRRVRRWLEGYDFKSRAGERRHSGPLIPRDGRGGTLTFMDLVEILYVRGFLRFGVSMPKIKVVHREARDQFGTPHPFAVKRFETDGRSIFYRFMAVGAERLEDRHRQQMVNRVVFDPLMKKIDYVSDAGDAEAHRYWPLGRDTPVFVDPRYGFGEAVVARSFVPTRVIYQAHQRGATTQRIAGWYQVDAAEVRAAIDLEELLRRPAAA
jgi:uncharacterized protein (DUF433 family)